MPSTIKTTGVTGTMLAAIAQRGGRMTTDRSGFAPSRVMLPLRRRGLVELRRKGVGKCRYNIWHLTEKGWIATGGRPETDQA